MGSALNYCWCGSSGSTVSVSDAVNKCDDVCPSALEAAREELRGQKRESNQRAADIMRQAVRHS